MSLLTPAATAPAQTKAGVPPLPLAEAAVRRRGKPGRPRRVLSLQTAGAAVQGAATAPVPEAPPNGHFAATVLPRGLPLGDAARYSGIPTRRLWAYLAEGRLQAIRPPGMRRVLLDRLDLDRLLEAAKGAGGPA